MLFNMKTKKVEKVITTLKDRIGHSLTLFHMGVGGRFCPPSDCLLYNNFRGMEQNHEILVTFYNI